jgi:hypothetical protein
MKKAYGFIILPMVMFIKNTDGSKEFMLGWLNRTIILTYGGNK